MTSGAERPAGTAGLIGTAGALIVSAAFFYLGTGLHPVWWLTWLAPLPVLLLAPRASARRTALVAALAHLLGMANVALYLNVVALPAPLIAGFYLITAGVFTSMVLLFRALLRRGRVLLAVLAAPALWAGAEYLVTVPTTFESVRVSLVAAPAELHRPEAGTAAGQALLAADLNWVRGMPVSGAQLVIFPEKDLMVDDATRPGVINPGSRGDRRSAGVRRRLALHALG